MLKCLANYFDEITAINVFDQEFVMLPPLTHVQKSSSVIVIGPTTFSKSEMKKRLADDTDALITLGSDAKNHLIIENIRTGRWTSIVRHSQRDGYNTDLMMIHENIEIDANKFTLVYRGRILVFEGAVSVGDLNFYNKCLNAPDKWIKKCRAIRNNYETGCRGTYGNSMIANLGISDVALYYVYTCEKDDIVDGILLYHEKIDD